ncbi:MAG: redoxin domain-containing protein, partial [Aquabacterium sp.]|uniref:redoxin family protein n=1 Tax=Aquabacterium sp. TaxID=1872578 RepID=UPI0011FD67BE
MKRFLLPLGIFLALAVFLGLGLKHDPREVPSPLIGKPAPAFNLPALSDANRSLRKEDMLGKVWMLNVWASWCGACRQEHPVLVEFARRNVVPIYGLNYKDERPDGLAWLREGG